MARTINEIYNGIVVAKNADSNLVSINSSSATAIWRLWSYIFAVASWALENIMDAFRAEVLTSLADMIPGTVRWYYNQCLTWQYGDALVWLNNTYKYAVIDANKQIVKFVAVSELYGQLIIKVGKSSGGLPVKLTSGELSSFTSYINSIKFAGTNVSVISYDADLIKFDINIVYDPMVMRPDGSLILDGSFPITAALNSYLHGIIYGGVFNKTKCIDAVQLVQGVVDAYFYQVQAKAYAAVNFNTITGQNYESISGAYSIDTLTVNYIPNV